MNNTPNTRRSRSEHLRTAGAVSMRVGLIGGTLLGLKVLLDKFSAPTWVGVVIFVGLCLTTGIVGVLILYWAFKSTLGLDIPELIRSMIQPYDRRGPAPTDKTGESS